MGSLWRSSPMELLQLIVQRDAAFETAEALGRVGLVQFRDLNPNVNAFSRTFAEEVKSIEELERKLRYFEKSLKQENKQPRDSASLNETLEDLEAKFQRMERDLRRESMTEEALQREMNQLLEEQHVLSQETSFFTSAAAGAGIGAAAPGRYSDDPEAGAFNSRVGYLTGLVSADKFESFRSLLFRATRGKLYLQDREVPELLVDPASGEKVRKRVFVILCAGAMTQGKAKKICESFGASVYPYPESRAELTARKEEIRMDLVNKETVLKATKQRKMQVLNEARPQVLNWRRKLARDKAVFHTLNLWRYVSGSPRVTAEAWVPKDKLDAVRRALSDAEKAARSDVPTVVRVIRPGAGDIVPTYFPLNKFTEGFQKIVDSYGVPRNGEVNPAIFTISTFPFLFAVMFGDWGHALLMLAFALFMIIREKQMEKTNLGEIFGMLFRGRYVLMMMALYSIYTGFIYNDVFSLAFDIFGSAYDYTPPANKNQIWLPRDGEVYPFGIDPIWYGKDNKLSFYNSVKMKMSVILGVTHMLMGVFAGLCNDLAEGSLLNVICEFIPEVLFLSCTFGYMCIMIFIKWSIDWYQPRAVVDPEHPALQSPPSLLSMMTNFFLSAPSGGIVSVDDKIYPGQALVQGVLVAIAFLSVPVLLLPKPLILRHRHKVASRRSSLPSSSKHDEPDARRRLIHAADAHEDDDEVHAPHDVVVAVSDEGAASSSGAGHGGHGEHGGEFNFGDIMVHQMIHTIEYVLGAISNTASYLRLWALSLAHSQLSEVFWDFVFTFCVKKDSYGGVFTFVGFAIWAALTLGVLLLMESLSAFLHALRLHWVEFQNKFYVGDGVKFIPFNLAVVEFEAEHGTAEGSAEE